MLPNLIYTVLSGHDSAQFFFNRKPCKILLEFYKYAIGRTKYVIKPCLFFSKNQISFSFTSVLLPIKVYSVFLHSKYNKGGQIVVRETHVARILFHKIIIIILFNNMTFFYQLQYFNFILLPLV